MDFPQMFGIRQKLASVLEQIRLDIDANVRKLVLIANEAESHGLTLTEALADEAAEVVLDFSEAFAQAYVPPAELVLAELALDAPVVAEPPKQVFDDFTQTVRDCDTGEKVVQRPMMSDATFKALLGLK